MPESIQIFLTSLLLSLLIQTIFFLFASAFKSDKVTDLSYGLSFLIISVYFTIVYGSFHPIQILITVMVSIWAIRLAGYLFIRILKIKKDARFDGIRENFVKFASFWFFQGITIWIILFPTAFILTTEIGAPNNLFTIIGFLTWATGLIIETIADYQKYTFKNNLSNKGKWVNTGLWKHARHPNYFGEILCWWGVFIVVLPYLVGLSKFTIIGPLYITYILLFVSGIPTLEKKYAITYKGNNEYENYKQSTRLLIPLPKRIA